jgi:6-phosphofructokinase 2
MKRIITLTMNPAVDKSTTVDHIAPEHKLRCQYPKYEPGGGGINVARAIHKLGGKALAIYPAGGHTGALMQELLEQEGVEQHVVSVESWTRENFIVVDESSNHQFRFGMPGADLHPKEWQDCLNILEHLDHSPDYIVASGSLPSGVPEDFFARVARIARNVGARFVLDTSGEALKLAANEGVFLLKPNLGELSKLSGVEEIGADMVEPLAREIINKGNCEVVVVSLGAAGAMLVTRDKSERLPSPTVFKRSTVGAGDSMVAGMVLSLAQEKSLEEMVRYGIASGTAATMNSGTELCRKEDVDSLYHWMVSHYPFE